jgi:hypothetical protein
MPFVLIIAGTILLVAGTRNTQADLYHLLVGDFTGQHNFVYWFLSIMVIGAIGYVPKMKPISEGFLILVILVLFLKTCPKDSPNCTGGLFDKFNQQLSSGTAGGWNTVTIGGVNQQLPLTPAQLKGLGL